MTEISGLSYAYADPETLDIGNVLRMAFQTFRQAPWRFVAFTLLPLPFAVAAGAVEVATNNGHRNLVIVSGLLTVLQYVFQIVGQNAAIYGAGRQIVGGSFTIGEAIGVGLRRFFPVIGVSILLILAVLLGLVLLVIPGLMLAAAFMVATPACVIERCGPIAALKRSAFLTKGNRWRCVGVFVLFLLIFMAAMIAVFVLGFIAIGIAAATQSQVATVLGGVVLVLLVVPVVFCLSAVGVNLIASLFVALRRLKEGNSAGEAVAQVFA